MGHVRSTNGYTNNVEPTRFGTNKPHLHWNPQMSNATLIAAQTGSANGINALLTQTRGYAVAVVAAHLGTKYAARIDAEDISQIVLMQIARDFARCEASDWASYLGWVRVVARNTTYREIERVKAAKRSADATVTIGETFDTESATATPDAICEAKERLQQVLAMAAGMSSNTQHVIKLLADGNTSEEISRQLGITMNGVYAVIKRFRSAAKAECLV